MTLLLVACPSNEPPEGAVLYTYEVLNTYPHDRGAFTQGLICDDGVFFESTGLFGESSLRRVNLTTGEVLQRIELDARFFGEGLTLFGGKLIQLTWLSNLGFLYDPETFEKVGDFSYPTEGWGITHDGQRLIMSDGTSFLYFLDPETFERLGEIEVADEDGPVTRLNELEFIDGEVFANVWQTDFIVRIAPETGRVLGWIDLEGLLSTEDRAGGVDVLNGIAYDDENGRLFVTGKLWPKIFEIKLLAAR